MRHIALKIHGRVLMPCLRISRLLQTPLGSTWYSYFSTIITNCLDPGYNYIWYNTSLPLVLTYAWLPGFSQHLLYFLIPSDLDQIFLSERVRGDTYAAGRPKHANFCKVLVPISLIPGANWRTYYRMFLYVSY